MTHVSPGSRKTTLFLVLTLLGMFAQTLPFALTSVPDAQAIAATSVPLHCPPEYSGADFAKARAFDAPIFWAGMINVVVAVSALFTLLSSGLAERVGQIEAPKARAWLARIAFLFVAWACVRLIDLPYLYFRFQHCRMFGVTSLGQIAWIKLYLAGLPVPLTLFILKYLLVICTLPLCKQYWWLAAALALFLIGSVLPEVLSRNVPLDPIEKRKPLAAGPHYESMKALLRKADLDLPILVSDESRRSKSASICLTGRSGREYVLLTDTFVQQYSPQQVTLALAHELGHFRRKTRVLLINQTSALISRLLVFWLAFLLTGRKALPVSSAPRVVLIAMLCSVVAGNVLSPVALALSRQEERFADRYALDMAHDPIEFQRLLTKVAQHELEPITVPAFEYYTGNSHPTILERIANAEK